jgi:hypothetical protein
MANLPGNGPTNEYKNRALPDGRYSGAWILVALVALIVIVGGGYEFATRSMGGASLTEHVTNAPTTPAMAPAAPPASTKP